MAFEIEDMYNFETKLQNLQQKGNHTTAATKDLWHETTWMKYCHTKQDKTLPQDKETVGKGIWEQVD